MHTGARAREQKYISIYISLCMKTFLKTGVYIYHQFMLTFFAFDNDDMESSKRRVTFLTLIFLLKCMSKSIVI